MFDVPEYYISATYDPKWTEEEAWARGYNPDGSKRTDENWIVCAFAEYVLIAFNHSELQGAFACDRDSTVILGDHRASASRWFSCAR